MTTPLPPPHHRSSSTSSIVAQTAQSFFLRLSNASTLQFDSSPASCTSISSHTPTPSSNSRRSSESLPPIRDPNYTFYTNPRFTRWNSEREQRRTASKNFLAFDPAYTRRNYISELRAATAEEYGADLLHHATGYPSPSAVPGTATTEQEDNSVYTHILSLREQIAAAEEASEMQRRRELHRNFSVFIPAPVTPRKMSAAETEVGSRRSSLVSLSPRTEYFSTPTRDSFELPRSPLDPTSHWRPPSTFWRREETLQFIEPLGRPAETFAQMPIVQAADTKGPLPPPPQKGLFRSRTLSVKKENKKPGGKRDGESNVGGRRGSGVSEKLRRKKNSLSGSGGILERAKTMRWGSVGSLGMYSAR